MNADLFDLYAHGADLARKQNRERFHCDECGDDAAVLNTHHGRTLCVPCVDADPFGKCPECGELTAFRSALGPGGRTLGWAECRCGWHDEPGDMDS